MRFMKTIRFKPKPDFLDEFLREYQEITERALQDGSIDTYFTAIVGDEIIYVGTFNEKEKDTKIIDKGLGWLDKYCYMLQKYSEEEGYARVESGAIRAENRV